MVQRKSMWKSNLNLLFSILRRIPHRVTTSPLQSRKHTNNRNVVLFLVQKISLLKWTRNFLLITICMMTNKLSLKNHDLNIWNLILRMNHCFPLHNCLHLRLFKWKILLICLKELLRIHLIVYLIIKK